MKKLMVVLMGLLFTASAFAQDAQGPQFKYNVWANAFAVTETTAAKDEVKDYSHIRVRPKFTLGNENVSVVTRLEIDQYFGGKEADSKTGNFYAPLGADRVDVEVKNVYIETKDIIIPGLSLKAGVAGYDYSIGFNEDVALWNIAYDAGMFKLDLAYAKLVEADVVEEDDTGKDEDDAAFYAAKAIIKAGNMTITPGVLYTQTEDDAAENPEQSLIMPSIAFEMKTGLVSLNADFQYITGDYDKDLDANAFAGYVNVGYKASNALSLSVFGLYATGESDDADEINSFDELCIDEIEVGPMFIINDAGYITQVGVDTEYDRENAGLMMFGLAAEFKMDKLTALGQFAYATTTSDELVDDTDLGMEFDLRLAYEVAPKTKLWGECAYLLAGDYIESTNGGDNDDPMYFAAGIMTSL